MEKKRLFVPIPIFIANIMATFFQILPKPLITKDQIKLLFYDNIPSGRYKTNFDIGKDFVLKFENEVEKYCYMWKEAGEYAKKKPWFKIMITWIIYIIVSFILFFVLYLAILGIDRGVKAKNANKSNNSKKKS